VRNISAIHRTRFSLLFFSVRFYVTVFAALIVGDLVFLALRSVL
jgi:hypothetical protein